VPASQLDELVWEDLCKVLTYPEHIRNALQRAHGGEWLPQEFKARLKTMGKALGQVERQKRRLLDAYLSGVLELPELERKRKELDGRSNTLLAQKRQLEASANERIELAKIADSIEQFCKQVKEGLSSATFEQKRTLVGLLIDQVVVTDEEVEIRYVIPTSPEGPHHPFCHFRTDYLALLPRVASGLESTMRSSAESWCPFTLSLEGPWIARSPCCHAGLSSGSVACSPRSAPMSAKNSPW
jgi:site-specific DNA recombinase